jgi:hypothetical protein
MSATARVGDITLTQHVSAPMTRQEVEALLPQLLQSLESGRAGAVRDKIRPGGTQRMPADEWTNKLADGRPVVYTSNIVAGTTGGVITALFTECGRQI